MDLISIKDVCQCKAMSLIIFTGLDGMLFSASELDYQPIAAVAQKLQQENIPLIPVTTKTRAEVEGLLANLKLKTPFIVEHGSGIFVPQDNINFSTPETSILDNYHLHQLGCSYTAARAGLKVVQEEINKILRGFGDMDEENIQSLIDSSQAARQAKSREFSEYFLTPSRLEIKQLQQVAEDYGFRIFPGDNLSLIIGQGASNNQAIQWLVDNYQTTGDNKLQTVGLGCTEQDLDLLETIDIPVIIPTSQGIAPCFADKDWQVVKNIGVDGWLESLTLPQLNIRSILG